MFCINLFNQFIQSTAFLLTWKNYLQYSLCTAAFVNSQCTDQLCYSTHNLSILYINDWCQKEIKYEQYCKLL